MGATDVCPLIPIANVSMEETADWARKLRRARVGNELNISVFISAASKPDRKNLAVVRASEYEGMAEKPASQLEARLWTYESVCAAVPTAYRRPRFPDRV
ncbi:MAG: hypothetical protein R2778_05985 [Saprospiraceae bacterium]